MHSCLYGRSSLHWLSQRNEWKFCFANSNDTVFAKFVYLLCLVSKPTTATATTCFYLCQCTLTHTHIRRAKKKETSKEKKHTSRVSVFSTTKFIARLFVHIYCERQLYINFCAGKRGHGQNIELRNEEIIVKFPVHRTTCTQRFA